MNIRLQSYDKFSNHPNISAKNYVLHTLKGKVERCSRWDRYLGMMTAMTQVPVPSMTIAHGIERAGAHNGERMLSSLLF